MARGPVLRLAESRLRLAYRDRMSEMPTALTYSLPTEVCETLITEGHATAGRSESQAAIPEVLMMGLVVVGSSADIVTLTNLPAALSAVSRFVVGLRGEQERYMKVKGPGGEATIRIRDELSETAVIEIVSAVWSAD